MYTSIFINYRIEDIELEEVKRCTFDSLAVYDGTDDTSPPIFDSFCGNKSGKDLRYEQNA